jgi:hypothetical protein
MVVGTLIGAVAVALWWYRYGTIVSPDGQAYLRLAAGHGGPAPFRWRLAVYLLGRYPLAWHWLSWSALAASAGLVGEYSGRHGIAPWAAAGLFAALPWFRGLVRMPILTDQLAMVCAIGAALVPWYAAIPLALLAGTLSERAPVFSAVFAWSFVPLVGLIVPAVMVAMTRGGIESHNDWRAMRELHNRVQPHTYVLPWGACLVAALGVGWQLVAAVALGYSQMLVATDRARLYQWSAPVVVVSALVAAPAEWWPAMVLATVAAPWCDWVAPWK